MQAWCNTQKGLVLDILSIRKKIIIFQIGIRCSNNNTIMQATEFSFYFQIDNVLSIFLSECFTTHEILCNSLSSEDKSMLLGHLLMEAICVQVEC